MNESMNKLLIILLLLNCGVCERPNVILIILDQYRHDVMGAWGNRAAETPNIDSLAQDGVLFSNAYTSTPSCTPARAAILTGRSPWGHGMLGFGAISQNYSFEMIHTLNQNGYFTSMIGKNHFGWYNHTSPVLHGYQYHRLYDGGGNGFPNTTKGYDDYDKWFQHELPGKDPLATGKPDVDFNSWHGAPYVYDSFYHPIAWVTRNSVDFINGYFNKSINTSTCTGTCINTIKSKSKSKDGNMNSIMNSDGKIKPLFLKISYHRPHSPYDPPMYYLNKTLNRENINKSFVIPDIIKSKDGWDDRYKSETKWCNQDMKDAWCGLFNDNLTYISRAAYYSNVEFIDNGIGTIINTLKKWDVYNNSLIILTADHGDQLGDHYLWRKTYPFESSAHIPMILKWSNTSVNINTTNININRIAPGSKIDAVVELRDILPTVMNSTGIDIDNYYNVSNQIEGMNLICLLYSNGNININTNTSDDCNWREYIDLEHDICYNKTVHWNALTDGKWKYIFNAYFASEQLFNLENDPFEEYDLALIANNNRTINDTLILWRQRMVNQFENEGRGNKWVQNGTLQKRTQSQLYGSNYPGHSPPINLDDLDVWSIL